MLRAKWRCVVCGATGWARAWSEDDTNAAGIYDTDPMDDACEHVVAGGEYDLVDFEYDDPFND